MGVAGTGAVCGGEVTGTSPGGAVGGAAAVSACPGGVCACEATDSCFFSPLPLSSRSLPFPGAPPFDDEPLAVLGVGTCDCSALRSSFCGAAGVAAAGSTAAVGAGASATAGAVGTEVACLGEEGARAFTTRPPGARSAAGREAVRSKLAALAPGRTAASVTGDVR